MGGHSLGRLCPKLTHLTLTHCILGDLAHPWCPGLQSLTLHGAILVRALVGNEEVPFLGPQLKSVDISATQIVDNELREIVGPPVAVRNWAAICMQCGATVHEIPPSASIRMMEHFPDIVSCYSCTRQPWVTR